VSVLVLLDRRALHEVDLPPEEGLQIILHPKEVA
jgi:hypothetical protein